MFWVLLLFAQSAAPTQIDRGEAIFFGSAHHCGSCHALKGKGTAVGPDLKGIARLSPKGIATAIRATATEYVQVYTLKSGRSLPSMPPKADQLFDLSKTPPEAVPATAADIASSTGNGDWKHPPSAQAFTPQDMADVIAYVRFAGANNRQTVSPDDIE